MVTTAWSARTRVTLIAEAASLLVSTVCSAASRQGSTPTAKESHLSTWTLSMARVVSVGSRGFVEDSLGE